MSERAPDSGSGAPLGGVPIVGAAPASDAGPGVSIVVSAEIAAHLPADAAQAQAAADQADADTIDRLPPDARGYALPERDPRDPALDVATMQRLQEVAHAVGIDPGGELSLLWKAAMGHEREFPKGIDPGRLALDARQTLATLDRTVGEDATDELVAGADALFAAVHGRGEYELARLMRDAAVRNPHVLRACAQAGRRLPALRRRRG
ncbi:MAG: hypothetical protein AMXMBFR42_30170 [Burkholderiales bacterium]